MQLNQSILKFDFSKANEELGKAIKTCRLQFPQSESRATPETDFIKLSMNDKCYLHCILNAQKVVFNHSVCLFAFNLKFNLYTTNKSFHQNEMYSIDCER